MAKCTVLPPTALPLLLEPSWTGFSPSLMRVVGPVQLALLGLVRGEVLQRLEIRPGVRGDDGEPILGQLARERPAARAGANDDEINFLRVAVPAHRHPAAGPERVGRAAADGAGGLGRVVRHAGSPRRARSSPPGWASAAFHASARPPPSAQQPVLLVRQEGGEPGAVRASSTRRVASLNDGVPRLLITS